ncbi:RFC checkpoint protein Rad17 [Sporothrix curviconia]|uniref:RFC checkpoint protein Rad17 n=1 Tax=Sporothrix curviconia TaxID=1260050 RepID=A0ABP0B4A7_9PEZI
MSAASQPESVVKRTYWTRQYVFSCNHTTVRHCGVRASFAAAIAPASPTATNVVPFLMPIRVSHECVICMRHRLVTRLEEKAKAVRSGFTTLCHGLDNIAKDTEKHRRSKDGNSDSQIQQDESWDNQPPSLASLMLIYSQDSVCTSSSSDGGAHLRLSEKIRRLREVLEQCKLSQGDAASPSDDTSDNAGIDASNVDMADLAGSSDADSSFGDSIGDTILDILGSVGDVVSAIADGLDTDDF